MKRMETVKDCLVAIAEAEVRMAEIAGEPLATYYDNEYHRECPAGGATLNYSSPISDRSYENWYPTVEAAKAALAQIARSAKRRLEDNGMYVDLTDPGCHDSDASVIDRSVAVNCQEEG